MHGAGRYELSTAYKKFFVDSSKCHSWSEERRRSLRQYFGSVWVGVGHYVNILAQFGSVWVCTVIFWVDLGQFGSVWLGLARFGLVWVGLGRCVF